MGLLVAVSPASAAEAPGCVSDALTDGQRVAMAEVLAQDGIRPSGLERLSAILLPTARVCAATHDWSVDAANAGADIALYREAMRFAVGNRGLGPERAARLERWLATENPDDVRRLSNSQMRGEERARMLMRMLDAIGPGDNGALVTYLVARERLADRRERFAGL
jgi:hypothetical protein